MRRSTIAVTVLTCASCTYRDGVVPMSTPGPVPARASRSEMLAKRDEGKLGKRSKAGGDAPAGLGGSFRGRPEVTVNAPTATRDDHLSTFAVDVDTAAYSIARRTLREGRLPEPSLVRVEEVLNYFHYDYDPPAHDAFSIQLDGARSPVDEAQHLLRVGVQARTVSGEERLPANLVFLFDTSCSMTSGDKLALAKKSVHIAVDRLDARDRVAITTYAGGVHLVLPPTSAAEKAKIGRAVDALEPSGGTAMESGLTLAYQQAAAMLRPKSVTRVIVLSDGDANLGATTPEAMLARIAASVSEGVRMSTIGFGAGNYRDDMMETIADKGNGNYFYVDGERQAERVFGRDLFEMIEDVAQDVKIQVDFDPAAVAAYRLVGYENRDLADADFRNDRADAGEIGAGHQVTALYELTLKPGVSAQADLATVRVRSKTPGGARASETERTVNVAAVSRPFSAAPADLRFATAAMGAAELWRESPHAKAWTYDRVLSLLSDVRSSDPDRAELISLVEDSRRLQRTIAATIVR